MTFLNPLDIRFSNPYKKYDYGVWTDTGKACQDSPPMNSLSAVRLTGCKMWKINILIGIIIVLILFYTAIEIIYYYYSGDNLYLGGNLYDYKTYYPGFTCIFMAMSLYVVNLGVMNLLFRDKRYKHGND
jgi:hypothetical protein